MVVSHSVILFFISKNLGTIFYDQEVQNLKDKIILVEPRATLALEENESIRIDGIFPKSEELSNVRFTVIARRGEMIADSHFLTETIADGFNLPEVIEAQRQAFGVANRYSEGFQEDIISVAKIIRKNGEIWGAIKADLPLTVLKNQLASIKSKISLIFLISFISVSILLFFLARNVTEPVKKMAEICEAMTKGDYRAKVSVTTKNELGMLSQMLNHLGEDLSKRVRDASEEKAKLKAMLQALKEGIIAIDREARILFTNQASYQLFIKDVSDCRGMKLNQVSGFSFLNSIALEVLSKKIPIHNEIIQDEKHIHVSATPFFTEFASGAVIVLQDRTDIRKLESMRRDFIANVSHELKTPLTAICGYVETLQTYGCKDQESTLKFIGHIGANAERLKSLVLDILTLAKIESLEGKMETHPCDWGFVINSVLSRHEANLADKKLKLHINPPSPPAIVEGEMEALEQVFENLLTNAIRYTPVGGSIDIKFRQGSSDITLEVSDTGLGIPSADQERIFERFYRVDRARSRDAGGTGLGLSIVKHLVSEMGGKISLESYPGRGSRFFVTLRKAF
jgi:two-component system phosphate regulon sensor histidine kinase PhoR